MAFRFSFDLAFSFSITSTILDQLSVAPAVAYSLRKLRTAYTGSAIRVRRSLDNAERDIGFDGTNLDTTALQNFVGSQNLLLHSDGLFTSPWIAGPAHTRTSNADIAPNGTTTATRITNTNSSTGNFTYQLQSTVTGQRTFSVYGKAETNRYLWIYNGVSATTSYGVLFDLQNGVVVLSNTIGAVTSASSSIQSVGNGWYRCSITHTQATNAYVAVTATNNTSPTFSANNDITNCTAGTMLVWGAQFNQGTLQPYSSTTRRNLLTFSESFENAVWEGLSGSAETINVNSELAPDGTMTADRCTVIGGNSGRYQQITLSSAGQITFSTHIKAGSSGTWARVGIYDTATPGNQARCWVNMETGELGTVSIIGTGWSGVTATSTDAGNGYYRVSVTATCTATAISVLVVNANANNDTVRITGHNRILWGAQLESGSLTPYQRVASAWTSTRDGNGFVATWYDQSGNARHVTQATAANQSRIVNSGVIDTRNAKPALFFSGSQWFERLATLSHSGRVTINAVADFTATNSAVMQIGGINQAGSLFVEGDWKARGSGNNGAVAPWTAGDGLTVVTGSIENLSQNIHKNGVSGSTYAGPINAIIDANITVGGLTSTQYRANGYISDCVVFPSILSTADRQTLERNQGSYFGITVA